MAVEPPGTTSSRARSLRTSAPSPRARRARAAAGRAAPARASARARGSTRSTRTSARRGTRRGAASTSSSRRARRAGKTLAFNLPVLDALARDPKLRALYLYPTKALAQDQARALADVRLPRTARRRSTTATRRASSAGRSASGRTSILTNPDMLHVGVLPHHDRWGDVLSNLRYVVVDEAHVYRGVFGSHVANVLRRLRRLARVYGAEPQFLLASATIANPGELARSLLGRRRDGRSATTRAPRAERTIALWNPPLLDEELGLRASALGEASRLLGGARRARPAHALLREEPQGGRADPPLHRRAPRRGDAGAPLAVPRRLHARAAARDRAAARRGRAARRRGDGRARARHRRRPARRRRSPSASPARSPSLRQQWGRAGRRGHGLAVLVASEDALDQYFMREPEALLRRPVEAAILDHANPRVLDGHVRAAAFEAPLDDADREIARRRGARARGRAPRAAKHAGGLRLGRPRLPGRARSAALGDPRRVHDRRRGDRHAARPRRARARVLDGARRRDLPPPRRAVPRARARPRARGPRSSSRSTATGTRRRRRRRRPRSREPLRARAARSASSSPSAASP